jgi:signal peptidase I
VLLTGAVAAGTLPGHDHFVTVVEPSDAMAPTVRVGDDVVLDRALVPVRGDVVRAVVHGRGPGYEMLSRVVALPGDTVGCPAAVGGGCAGLVVDGVVLPETYVEGTTEPFATVTVPAGRVFLLGDHRPVAADSRVVGAVPLDDVTGVVVSVTRGGRTLPVVSAPPHAGPGGSDTVDPPAPPPAARVGTPS